MRSDLINRYGKIKKAITELLESKLIGIERVANQSGIFIDNTIYRVNADFNYMIDGNQMAEVLTRIQEIIDELLLEGDIEKLWAGKYIEDAYRIGTVNSFSNLSAQSVVYANSTTISSILFSDVYVRRIGLAYVSAFSEWKGVAESLWVELGKVLSNAVARGVNPRETAKIITKRLDISLSKAKVIAQTQQVGALRKATWNETERVNEELNLKTGLLHLSALKPSSRLSHAERHGKCYTVEEVRQWYEERGNAYNCYCAQVAVLLDDNGKPFDKAYHSRLESQSKNWKEQNIIEHKEKT